MYKWQYSHSRHYNYSDVILYLLLNDMMYFIVHLHGKSFCDFRIQIHKHNTIYHMQYRKLKSLHVHLFKISAAYCPTCIGLASVLCPTVQQPHGY